MVCQRCGLCCTKSPKNHWIDGLTWQDKQDLLEERKKYPKAEGCSMLYYADKAFCLVEVFLGKEKKSKVCSDYPKVGQCMRED